MGYDFRCGGCYIGNNGIPRAQAPWQWLRIPSSVRGERCLTEWCEEDERVVWLIEGSDPPSFLEPGTDSPATHAGHVHRGFPLDPSDCVACPACGSSDIETRTGIGE